MGIAITVRDVPQETRNELASRAAQNGQSMQEFLRRLLIDAASRPLQSEVLRDIRARTRASGSTVTSETIVDIIREDRASH